MFKPEELEEKECAIKNISNAIANEIKLFPGSARTLLKYCERIEEELQKKTKTYAEQEPPDKKHTEIQKSVFEWDLMTGKYNKLSEIFCFVKHLIG